MRKYAIHIATAAAVLTGMSAADAADLDYGVLRGASDDVYVAPIDWSGFYIGGHGGYTSSNMVVGRGLQTYSDVALNGLRFVQIQPTPSFSSREINARETTYGGFAGYNLQFDDTVVGIEVDYTRGMLRGQAGDVVTAISRDDGRQDTANRQSSLAVTDYGTVRARAGYAIGSLLPFATAGLAVARLEETNSIGSVAGAGSLRLIPAQSRTRERYTFGFAIGAGLDFALTNNIMLRGEYQHAQFDHYTTNSTVIASDGSSSGKKTANTIANNTFRGGIAVKF